MVLADSHKISPVPWYSGACGAARCTPTGLSPSLVWLSRPLRLLLADHRMQVLQPWKRRNAASLGWSPFARHYLGSHYCFLFLRLLRCFSSPGWLLLAMFLPAGGRSSTGQVFPFGNPRIAGYLPLPVAYRSLSRPSSPSRAKASAVCS